MSDDDSGVEAELHYEPVMRPAPIRRDATACACHPTEADALDFIRWWNFHAAMRADRKGGKWWRD